MRERNTVQKTMIYNALCRLSTHPTADEIYDYVRVTSPRISRATVYRVLNHMAEKGTVQRIRAGSGADHYDHTLRPHYHIVCRICGRMCDADFPYMEGLEKRLGAASGFHVTDHTLQFNGICPACASRAKEDYG